MNQKLLAVSQELQTPRGGEKKESLRGITPGKEA
jgi:hypothetical protein